MWKTEILALEKERRRIASDLHDDLGPILSAIKFKINAVETTSGEDNELIQKASSHVDEAILHIRKITFELMPNTLARNGLAAAAEELFGKLEGSLPLEISYSLNPVTGLPHQKAINLYDRQTLSGLMLSCKLSITFLKFYIYQRI